MSARKGLTATQKALAEKTIKLKYNGLIMAIANSTTKVEKENEPLPLPPVMPNEYHWKVPRDLRGQICGKDYPLPPSIDRLIEEIDREMDGLQRKVDSLSLALRMERERVIKENDERDKKIGEAREAKHAYTQTLAAERDNTILRIAFEGESSEMLDFLKSLPGPAKAMDDLKALGFELAAPISEETGIGKHTPKQLSGPTEVSVSIQ